MVTGQRVIHNHPLLRFCRRRGRSLILHKTCQSLSAKPGESQVFQPMRWPSGSSSSLITQCKFHGVVLVVVALCLKKFYSSPSSCNTKTFPFRFFWLPFFLANHFTPAQSNLISVLYDVGMMPGTVEGPNLPSPYTHTHTHTAAACCAIV